MGSLILLFMRGPSLTVHWMALYECFRCSESGSQHREQTSCFALENWLFIIWVLLNQLFSSVSLHMITCQRMQGYCTACSPLSLIKSLVKVIAAFFNVKLHFLEHFLALNIFLSFYYYSRWTHIRFNVSREKLKRTPTVSRARANRAPYVLCTSTTKCFWAKPVQTAIP